MIKMKRNEAYWAQRYKHTTVLYSLRIRLSFSPVMMSLVQRRSIADGLPASYSYLLYLYALPCLIVWLTLRFVDALAWDVVDLHLAIVPVPAVLWCRTVRALSEPSMYTSRWSGVAERYQSDPDGGLTAVADFERSNYRTPCSQWRIQVVCYPGRAPPPIGGRE